jgi:hypothetical protein
MTYREDFLAALPALRTEISRHLDPDDELVLRAGGQNPWFTPEFTHLALQAIADDLLEDTSCRNWLNRYPERTSPPKRIGLILAGNLPAVGFHDVFCVLASGHHAVVKLSDKDSVLLPALMESWQQHWPELASRVSFVDRISGIDAVIATGTDNASRHFDYYFRQYPRLLRGHRNGVAVLRGDETPADMAALMEDVFLYFGLGCRNVSALLVPADYDFADWFDYVAPWARLAEHHKYKHNLDYNLAIYMINGLAHLDLGPLIIRPDESIASRIGSLHYRTYSTEDQVKSMLEADRDKIQCVVSRTPVDGWEHIRPGQSQHPRPDQYADGEDTMAFLLNLS